MLPPSALCPAPPRANRQPVRGAPRARALSLRTRPGGEGRGVPTSLDAHARGRALSSAVPDPGLLPQTFSGTPSEHRARGFTQPPCSLPATQRGTLRGPTGVGRRPSRGSLGARCATLCPWLCHFPYSLFSLKPATRLGIGPSACPVPSSALGGCGPRRWRRAPAAPHPPAIPRRALSPPPPFRPRAWEQRAGWAEGGGREGGGA